MIRNMFWVHLKASSLSFSAGFEFYERWWRLIAAAYGAHMSLLVMLFIYKHRKLPTTNIMDAP